MTLEEIAERAIPFKDKDCNIIRDKKVYDRQKLVERVMQWHGEQMAATISAKDLTTPIFPPDRDTLKMDTV